MSQAPTTSQFQLLTQRRFAPFFWTQFLGAGNDNIFKFAFTVLATYHAVEWGGLQPALAGPVIGGLLTLASLPSCQSTGGRSTTIRPSAPAASASFRNLPTP